jgi:hypothetical protein
MAGKFMQRDAVIDTQKAMEAVNARQKRAGTLFAVRSTACGCPDPGCGAFHVIDTSRPLPTAAQADATLKQRKSQRHR